MPPNLSSLSCKLSRLRASSVLNQTRPADILAALDQWNESFSGDAPRVLVEPSESLRAILLASEDSQTEAACLEFLEPSRFFARELGIAPGEQMLVVNGRVSTFYSKLYLQDKGSLNKQIIGPINDDEFTAEDFPVLADYEMSRRVAPVLQAYKNITGHEPETAG